MAAASKTAAIGQMVPVAAPSLTNPRKGFPESSIAELAERITVKANALPPFSPNWKPEVADA
jgi:hypothetical protein